MSNTTYSFNEFSEDDARHSLAQKAKPLLQQCIHMSNAYQNHRNEFFGMTECILYLMDLQKKSFVLICQNKFIDDMKRTGATKSSESKKKNPSTPVKTNRNNFTALKPKHLSFDNIANEFSENETKGLEKQPTSVIEILRSKDSKNSPQENVPVSALISEISSTVSESRRQQSTAAKPNGSATQSKYSPQENIPVSALISDLASTALASGRQQPTAVNLIGSATESKISSLEDISVSAQISDVFRIVSASGKQLSTPVTENKNATELASLPSKNLSPSHKKIIYADPVNQTSNTTAIQGAGINLSTEIRRNNINPIIQDHKTVGQSDADKGKPEKSDEAVNMYCMFIEKVERNTSPYKEVRVQGVPNKDCRNNTQHKKSPKAMDNPKPISSTQESSPIFQASKNETDGFSLSKIAKRSGDSGTKSHHISPSFDKKIRIPNKVKVQGVPNREHPTALDSPKPISLTQKSSPTFQASKNETEEFSPAKIAKISGDSGTNSHTSPSFDKNTGILDKDSIVNISPNQGINIFKTCERKKKAPFPRKDSVLTADCRNNTGHRESSKAADNEKPSTSTQEILSIFQTSKNETQDFSPAKIVKISGDFDTNSHKSPSFDEKTKILDQDSNVSPNQGINIFKSPERKRKSPSQRKNSVPRFILLSSLPEVKAGKYFLSIDYSTSSIQCRSIKRNLNISRAIEIDVSTGNPNPTKSSISSIDAKSVKTTTDNTDQDKLHKVKTFGGNKSSPETSRDYLTNSSSGSGYKNCSIGNVLTDLERDCWSYEILQAMQIKKFSLKNVSARPIKNLDLEVLKYCIAQFKDLLQLRNICSRHIYDSLKNLKNTLELLCHHIEVMVKLLRDISILRSDHISDNLQTHIYLLVFMATKIVDELEELQIYVVLDLQNWVINFCRYNRILSSHYEPKEYNNKPSRDLEYLHVLENHVKLIWVLFDEEIENAEFKRLNFLSTEKNFMKFINMFTECLVKVGILKL